jgi:hypothetical protein
MKTGLARSAACLALIGALAAPVWAATESAGQDRGRITLTVVETMRDVMTQAHRIQRRSHMASADLDGSGLRVRAERVRTGEKALHASGAGDDWHRRYSAQIEGWTELGGGLRATADVRLDRTTDGFAGGPLLTSRSQTLSQQADFGIGLPGRGRIGVSLFDTGGWSPGDTAQEANRIINGEEPARKGVSFGISDIPIRPLAGAVNAKAGFELQRLSTPFSAAAATAARLSLRLQF